MKRKLRHKYIHEDDQLTYDALKNPNDNKDLKNSNTKTLIGIINTAFKNNKYIGLTFIKSDGSVRNLVGVKKFKDYNFSDREKTEKQEKLNENNNLVKLIDINLYKKLRNNGFSFQEATARSYKTVKLQKVAFFKFGDKLYNLIEENFKNFTKEEIQTLIEYAKVSDDKELKKLGTDENLEKEYNEEKKTPTPEIDEKSFGTKLQESNKKKLILTEKQFHNFINKVIQEYKK